MITASVRGGAELRYVAGRLRKAAARDLTRELRAGQRSALRPLQREIKVEAAATLPGGYGPLMAKAVRVSLRRGGGAVFVARVYARGRAELRDVRAVNGGTLRHPLFGNRGHWYTTRVRPGFVDRPADRVMDRVLDECAEAVERVLTSIARS
jgi:hypothetical protein